MADFLFLAALAISSSSFIYLVKIKEHE